MLTEAKRKRPLASGILYAGRRYNQRKKEEQFIFKIFPNFVF